MKAPFYPLGAFGEEAGFVLIFFLGLAFGFFLERAGFGSARKLTAIFYFRDFAVLRVMFTAVIVAMTGLLYLSAMGWLEMEAMNIPATILGAQVIGGLLLGVGFVVGGYCPGTSVVGAASGKLDALAYMGGLLFGAAVFGLSYDPIQGLYHWGERGVVTLADWSGINAGVLAFAVVAIALAAFAASEYADRRKGGSRLRARWSIPLTWQRAAAALLVVLSFGLVVGYSMAARVSSAAPAPPAAVATQQTASPGAPAAAAQPGTAPSPAAPLRAAPGGLKKFKKGASCS